jgi:methylenetetrahydrofolate reductase (NADPH)
MPRPGGGVVEDRDEYPNGLFTNVRSPAKGEVDGSGRGLNVTASILWPAQLNTWLT